MDPLLSRLSFRSSFSKRSASFPDPGMTESSSTGWQSPRTPRQERVPSNTTEQRLFRRSVERMQEGLKRSQSRSGSPRIGSPREKVAYEILRRSLNLAEDVCLGKRAEEEEARLNQVRRLAQTKRTQCLSDGDTDAYLLTREDLEQCGLPEAYPFEIRVLPLSNTLLFRNDFIARGAQKCVWGSREFLIDGGYWCREVVEYECQVDSAAVNELADFLASLGVSECFPPAPRRIGTVSSRNAELYMQSIRFEGTAHDIDPSEDFQRALSVYCDAAKALRYLHAHRVLHRDVKGGNIMVRGTEGYLTDYDDACRADDVAYLVDTPTHAAPEFAERGARNSYASDCWAFGMTLWQGFYGRAHQVVDTEAPLQAVLPPFGCAARRLMTVSYVRALNKLSDEDIGEGLGMPLVDQGTAEDVVQRVISGLLIKDPQRRLRMNTVVELLEHAIQLSKRRAAVRPPTLHLSPRTL